MKRWIALVATALALPFAFAVPAHATTTTRYVNATYPTRSTFGIAYKTIKGARLTLDVWEPADKTANRRWVLLMHGGGFVEGNSRDGIAFYADALALHGYVVFSVNYRLTPHAWDSPESRASAAAIATSDVIDAERWVRAKAKFLRIDPTEVFAVGYSAGAVIAWNLANAGNVRAAASIAGYSTVDGAGNVRDWHGTGDTIIPLEWATNTCPAAACSIRTFTGDEHDVGYKRFKTISAEIPEYLATAA